MKSPFLIDLCIISDKSLSSSYPPYLGYFLSPLVPHCPLVGLMQVHSTAFPKMPPVHAYCLLYICCYSNSTYCRLSTFEIAPDTCLHCRFTLCIHLSLTHHGDIIPAHYQDKGSPALKCSHTSQNVLSPVQLPQLNSSPVSYSPTLLALRGAASKPPGDSVQGTKCDLAP